MEGTPRGSIGVWHPSGWIQADLFVDWLRHFISHTKPTAESPVMLILDGHYSHTRNLSLIDFAQQNSVHIVCLPPHTSHRMQPLDVAFMSPFKTSYAQEVTSWLRDHPNRVFNHYSIGKVVGEAYKRSATMSISEKGFSATGLCPINRYVFPDEDFVSDPMSKESDSPPTAAGTSVRTTPEEIAPMPNLQSTISARQGSSNVLTSDLYREKLIESQRKIQRKSGRIDFSSRMSSEIPQSVASNPRIYKVPLRLAADQSNPSMWQTS